jgi:hypothetical protein
MMDLQLKWMMLHVSLNQESESKNNHVHVVGEPANKGQEKQETAVPSARPGDKNSGDRE